MFPSGAVLKVVQFLCISLTHLEMYFLAKICLITWYWFHLKERRGVVTLGLLGWKLFFSKFGDNVVPVQFLGTCELSLLGMKELDCKLQCEEPSLVPVEAFWQLCYWIFFLFLMSQRFTFFCKLLLLWSTFTNSQTKKQFYFFLFFKSTASNNVDFK